MTKKSIFLYAFLLPVLLYGCINASNKKELQRKEIANEIERIKSKLPVKIPNTPLTLNDVSYENDMVTYVATMPQSFWEENYSFDSSEQANSDRNIARMLNMVGESVVSKFLDNEIGLKYIYRCSETGKDLMIIEADAERLRTVKKGLDSGEIKPYTIMELFQLEINRYEFPSEIDDGVWLTDAYIRGNSVYYIANLESDITSDDISYSDLQEMKSDVLAGLSETMIIANKKEIARNNVHIIYVYKNNDGNEFARIEITADDF